jgi:drug/metabolite transporter (DMT)-like permease
MLAGTGATLFFPHYRFEHPITGRMISVNGFSYFLAAFLGPVWVAFIGRRVRGVLMSIVVSGVYTVGILMVTYVAANYTSAANGILMLVFLIPALITLHGRSQIFVLREDFRRRGWMVNIE